MQSFRSTLQSIGLLLLLTTAGGEAFAQSQTKSQLQTFYQEHLRAEGFRPELTSTGHVRFRREGRIYVIFIDERDPAFFNLGSAIKSAENSPAGRQKKLEACNAISVQVKAVKCYIDDEGDPIFSAESFMKELGDAPSVFSKAFRSMDAAIERYVIALSEEEMQ